MFLLSASIYRARSFCLYPFHRSSADGCAARRGLPFLFVSRFDLRLCFSFASPMSIACRTSLLLDFLIFFSSVFLLSASIFLCTQNVYVDALFIGRQPTVARRGAARRGLHFLFCRAVIAPMFLVVCVPFLWHANLFEGHSLFKLFSCLRCFYYPHQFSCVSEVYV